MRESITAWIADYIQENSTKNKPLATWEEPLKKDGGCSC